MTDQKREPSISVHVYVHDGDVAATPVDGMIPGVRLKIIGGDVIHYVYFDTLLAAESARDAIHAAILAARSVNPLVGGE